jgi:hypothetical protein
MCKNYILRMLILDKYLLHANTQPLISFIDIYYKKNYNNTFIGLRQKYMCKKFVINA